MVAAAASIASIALPPSVRTSAPACAARWCGATVIPPKPRVVWSIAPRSACEGDGVDLDQPPRIGKAGHDGQGARRQDARFLEDSGSDLVDERPVFELGREYGDLPHSIKPRSGGLENCTQVDTHDFTYERTSASLNIAARRQGSM